MKYNIQLIFYIIIFSSLNNSAFAQNVQKPSEPIYYDNVCNIAKGIHIENGLENLSLEPAKNYKLEFNLYYSPFYKENIDYKCVNNIFIDDINIANYDAQKNEIIISKNAKDGDKFSLSYNINQINYKRDYYIINLKLYPLIGLWHEIPNPSCKSLIPQEQLVKELDLKTKDVFAITWQPFETYHDYWGEYEFNNNTNIFKIDVTKGNYIPDDIVSIGEAKILENGNLQISGVFFGNNKNGQTRGNKCGHLFTR